MFCVNWLLLYPCMQNAEQDFVTELAALARIPVTVKKQPSKKSKPAGWYDPGLS